MRPRTSPRRRIVAQTAMVLSKPFGRTDDFVRASPVQLVERKAMDGVAWASERGI